MAVHQRKKAHPNTNESSSPAPKPHPPKGASDGSSLLVALCILVSFTTAVVTTSSLVRLGPQYLEPVFGNTLPYVDLFVGVAASFAVGCSIAHAYWQAVPVEGSELTSGARTARVLALAFDIVAILAATVPQRVALMFKLTSGLGPRVGASLVQTTLLFPITALSGFATMSSARWLAHGAPAVHRTLVSAAYVSATMVCVWVGQSVMKPQASCAGLMFNALFAGLSSAMVKILGGLQERRDSAGRDVPRRERQLQRLRFLPSVATVFLVATTVLTSPQCAPAPPESARFHVVARAESLTGWVAAVDDGERGLRVLRSGHSIIGGAWNTTGESIFGVFYYPDAMRYMAGRPATGGARAGPMHDLVLGPGSERALQIGLGIGVSAKSLHDQNVRVDVAELDGAVYSMAVEHFGLPRNLNRVYIRDARAVLEDSPSSEYDYVVHDVFTGGSVPARLFSAESVALISRALRPRGVLALNYVGVLDDARTRAHIARTLRVEFPNVRCFAEATEDPHSIVNMVFFASKSPIVFEFPAWIRGASEMDTIRMRVLSQMEANEIDVGLADGESVEPLTDSWNPLAAWQVRTATMHWNTMRELFPSSFWLNY